MSVFFFKIQNTEGDDNEDSFDDSENILVDFDVIYSLKFVNPTKKSEYTIRKWRIKQKFETVDALASKLLDNFKELKPVDEQSLSIGYVEPGHGYKGKQRWLYSDEDLQEMYSIYSGKKEILLWCFLPGKQPKRPAPTGQDNSNSKRSKIVEVNSNKMMEVQEIVTKLQSKHGANFSPEHYHAWGQLIQIKKHSSCDEPPAYSFFKNRAKSKPATAPTASAMPSPIKRVQLRTELFTQLEKLGGLFDKGSLTQEQFEELKQNVLGDIKEL